MTAQTASFNDVPDDLLEYLFLHLSPYGELQNCRLVSKRWSNVANAALERLRRLFVRCSAFEWFLLQSPDSAKFATNIAERCSHAACYHPSGTVFVFGGCTAAYTTFNDLWKFNLTKRTWVRPVPMGTYPTPKACSTMVEYKGNLILFGGWSKSSPNPIHQTAMFYNELHVYDPLTNFWTQIVNDGTAPHLAGHSATIVGDRMIVFGGSHGTVSSNHVWVLDIPATRWFTPMTSTPKPSPRYGQSQVLIDDHHVLIVGGCGGPNHIYSDVWLLTMGSDNDMWQWTEIQVQNQHLSAPHLWSHPACKVGSEKLVVLSKPPRCNAANTGVGGSGLNARRMLGAPSRYVGGAAANVRSRAIWVPPQGTLSPPRRKLISSRSLDEDNPSPSPKSTIDKKSSELQRAHSIPTIIVGEIPKLVVTEDNSNSDANSVYASGQESGSDEPSGSRSWPSPCIAVVASSLLPQHGVSVEPPMPMSQAPVGTSTTGSAGRPRTAAAGSQQPPPPASRYAGTPMSKEKRNREKQLEVLRRMEEYIRSQSHHQQDTGGGGSGGAKMKFRPSSPPPKPKQHRSLSFHPSKNPMCVYVLDLSRVLRDKLVSWRVLEGSLDAPEDTILYSLVQGRGELILFGGMRSSSTTDNQGLDVTPFTHSITNETYILRPPISF